MKSANFVMSVTDAVSLNSSIKIEFSSYNKESYFSLTDEWHYLTEGPVSPFFPPCL